MIDRTAIFIPGPRKCGTSTLSDIITQHELIDTPKRLESQFFILEEEVVRENLDMYLDLYSNDSNKKIFDGSTLYFSSDRAIKNIKNFFEDVRIIIILRDPVKRAHSAFWHLKKRVPSREKRNFEEIIKKIEGPDFKSIMDSENKALKEAINMNQIDKNWAYDLPINKLMKKFEAHFEDPLWEYKYFQGSLYSQRFKKWNKLYDDIKTIYLEKLIEEPRKTIIDIFDFIGLDVDKIDLRLPHSNKTLIPSTWFTKTRLGNLIGTLFQYVKNEILKDSQMIGFIKKPSLYVCDQIENFLYEPRPKISKKEYSAGKELLKKEYEYWYSKNPDLEELWKL